MPLFSETVSLIPLFVLQIVPFCLVGGVYLISLFFRRKRPFVWLLVLTETCSCALWSAHGGGDLLSVAAHGFLLASLIVLLLPLLRLGVRMGKRKMPAEEGETEELFKDAKPIKSLPVPPAPKAIIVQNEEPMPAKKGVNDDVQLAHVFQVLKKLKGVKLNAGDRLEVDVIYNMVTVYQSKESLSVEETHALNNYLATLLKLMSKYSL